LLFVLYRYVWVIDLLVNLPIPHPGVLACPSTPEVLWAREHAPTPSHFIVFIFGLVVKSIKVLKGASFNVSIVHNPFDLCKIFTIFKFFNVYKYDCKILSRICYHYAYVQPLHKHQFKKFWDKMNILGLAVQILWSFIVFCYLQVIYYYVSFSSSIKTQNTWNWHFNSFNNNWQTHKKTRRLIMEL
jgi:hypothetical protein